MLLYRGQIKKGGGRSRERERRGGSREEGREGGGV